MKILQALLITMNILMKIVIKSSISMHEISEFEDAIADVESQIKRLEDAANDEN